MTHLEKIARELCIYCGENPDHEGDCRGNKYRWQDYIDMVRIACGPDEQLLRQALEVLINADTVIEHLQNVALRRNTINTLRERLK